MARRFWRLVLCAAAVLALAAGIRQALGLFLVPITQEIGGGREIFALSAGMLNLVWGLAAPFAGALADRYGPGRAVAAGALCYVAGLYVMTLPGDGAALVTGGVLIGLAMSGTGFTVTLGAVGRAVPEDRRTQALAIVAIGGSVGQFLAPAYAYGLIVGWVWIWALILLAGTAALMVPLAAGVATRTADGRTAAAWGDLRRVLRRAAARRSFWLLSAGFFVCGFQLTFVAVHFPAYMIDRGMAAWVGAWALTLAGLVNIGGTYGFGFLATRFRKKTLLSVLYLGRAAAFLLLLILPSTPSAMLFCAALIGLLWTATIPLTGGLVAQLWGAGSMTTMFGVVFFSHQLGAFLGAWLAGRIFDVLGSYTPMWWFGIALGVAAAALHWPIAERRAAAAPPAEASFV